MAKKATSDSNGHAPVRAVLYARVSTEEQGKHETIETQTHYARQQCEREGTPLGRIYKDEGVSGTVPFDQRPGGRQLLADARAGKFNVVLLYKVDRLGRVGYVSHVAQHHLETLQVGVRSLTEPFDTTTPTGRFMFSILAANSAMERENITQRTKAGLHRVASQGRWANGRPPYGYRIEEHRLVPDEQEAAVVKTIFRLATTRHTLIGICEHLNARNVPTREGKRWRFANVARMLHRRAYRGAHEWGKADKVSLPVTPLVSEEVWDKAQEALRLNAKASRGNSKRDYLLKSLIRCGFRDRSMTGIMAESKGGKIAYYRCVGKVDPYQPVKCGGRYPNAERIENLVWNTLADWMLRREDLETALKKALQEQDAERREFVQTVTTLKKQLTDKTTERDRVVTAFRRGHLSEDDLAQQLVDIDQEQRRLQATVAEMEDRDLHLDTAYVLATIRQHLDTYRRDVQRGSLPFARKRRIVESFVEGVRVRIPKGGGFSGQIREVIPYRERDRDRDRDGATETLWQRERQGDGAPAPMVEVRYRFPWPTAENLMVTDSLSLKKR